MLRPGFLEILQTFPQKKGGNREKKEEKKKKKKKKKRRRERERERAAGVLRSLLRFLEVMEVKMTRDVRPRAFYFSKASTSSLLSSSPSPCSVLSHKKRRDLKRDLRSSHLHSHSQMRRVIGMSRTTSTSASGVTSVAARRNHHSRNVRAPAAMSSSLSEAFEVGVKGSEVTVPVPIDYYKVLGLGSQRHASSEELERAYSARVRSYDSLGNQVQSQSRKLAENVPGMPFSTDAVEGRRRVLDLAREALMSRSPQRSRIRVANPGGGGGSGGIALRPTHESVAIPLSWVTGLLLLAVECGDFENCVGVGSSLLERFVSISHLSLFFPVSFCFFSPRLYFLLTFFPSFTQIFSVIFSFPPDRSRSALGFASQDSLKLNQKQKRDISLAVALSHCELAKVFLDGNASSAARTRGQKRRVAEGCAHLNLALETLKSAPGQRLMPLLCEEVEYTLERLVAPCALDHLRLPLDEEHKETRKRAALVLEELLVEPPVSDDESSAAIDRTFVHDVMKALTVRETINFLPWRSTLVQLQEGSTTLPWFEPSTFYTAAVSCLLSAYLDKKPKLVRRALDLFETLEAGDPSVDLATEYAVSMMLLGKVDAALELLEEAESAGESSIRELEQMEAEGLDKGLPNSSSMMMTFIRFNARGGGSKGVVNVSEEGLLEGICTFTEMWLELKAVPLFRDTNRQYNSLKQGPISLIQYFDDPGVRNYANSRIHKIWAGLGMHLGERIMGKTRGFKSVRNEQEQQQQQNQNKLQSQKEPQSQNEPQSRSKPLQWVSDLDSKLSDLNLPSMKVLGICALLAVLGSRALSPPAPTQQVKQQQKLPATGKFAFLFSASLPLSHTPFVPFHLSSK